MLLSVGLLPPLQMQVGFTVWGLPSGCLLFFVQHLAFKVLGLAGVSVGISLLAGSVVVFSVLADVLLFGKHPTSPSVLVAAIIFVLVGLAGLCYAKHLSVREAALLAGRAEQIELAVVGPGSEPSQEPAKQPDEEQRAGTARRPALTIAMSAVAAGIGFTLYNGLQNQAPEALRGLAFSWSVGIGIGLTTLLCTYPLFYAVHRRPPSREDFGSRREALVGAASGTTLGVALILMDAGLSFGVQLGVANAIFQTAVFVAGLWGIVLHKEVAGKSALAVFSFCICVLFGGIVLEATTKV